jgi:predicted aconitase with swiveling domain
MTSETFIVQCKGAAPGKAAGPALVSRDAICFYLVDPTSGIVIESGHALEGKNVAGAVVAFPSGKGSTSVQTDGLFVLARAGLAPAALVVQEFDTVLVASAVMIGIPLVRCSPEDFARIDDGDMVDVDADSETLTIRSGVPTKRPSRRAAS